MVRPTATRTSPTTETAAGTADQPKRKSSALITIMATTDTNATVMMSFCRGRVSAPGPACMRRRSASGFFTARYTLGIRVAAANTAMNAQPCQ